MIPGSHYVSDASSKPVQSATSDLPGYFSGDVLAGKYRLDGPLGSGGMGVVAAAHHLQLDKPVAIKMLHADLALQPKVVARFEREARAAARIQSEHCARVFDVDTLPDGVPFMVLERLEGSDLGRYIEQCSSVPVADAVDFVLQACEAIAEAHSLGIVHRDLKPANLFLTKRLGIPCIKVLDFGISKLLGEAGDPSRDLTAEAMALGTWGYMAPEQLGTAKEADCRADVWGLGVVLYELLTRSVPGNIYVYAGPPPSSVRGEVPAELDRVISRCLQIEREARFSNIAELALELVAFGNRESAARASRSCDVLRAAGLYSEAVRPLATQRVPATVEVPSGNERTVQARVNEPAAQGSRAAIEGPGAPATSARERGLQPRVSVESARLVRLSRVFIDESFLLDARAQRFVAGELLAAFELYPTCKLRLPKRIYDTLCAQAKTSNTAKRAVEIIHEFVARKRLDLRGESDEVVGVGAGTRDLLVRVLYQHQLRDSLSFLTQDRRTAAALLATNRMQAVKYTKPLHVLRIDEREDRLIPWQIDDPPVDYEAIGQGPDLPPTSIPKDARIFVDTCTLMDESGVEFVGTRLPSVLGPGRARLLVPKRVLTELQKHERTPDKAQVARKGRRVIEGLLRAGLGELRHDEREIVGNDMFADPLILRVFVQHQKSKPLVLITQDGGLARQVLENARYLVDDGRLPTVGYVSDRRAGAVPWGELGSWPSRLAAAERRARREQLNGSEREREADRTRNHSEPLRDATRRPEPANGGTARMRPVGESGPRPVRESDAANRSDRPVRERAFLLARDVYRGSTALISVPALPDEGSSVVGEKSGRLRLEKRLAQGGEGAIFSTSLTNTVCKIYFAERLSVDRRAKLERMVTRRAPAPTICWPLELVHDEAGNFVGYLMPQARGEVFNLTVFKRPLLEETFPDWQREHLVQLAISTLTLIERLHALNVLIGDINPNNFMVVSEHEVYLVDTDSFQVEEFPCPVGTPHFTPPELIGKSYVEQLRTKEHEAFAIATLLFMILLYGKPPYAGQGAGEVVENIRNQKFPYVKEEGERSAKPFGPYRFIWSHLPSRLKNTFIEVFADGHRVPPRDSEKRRGRRVAHSYLEDFQEALALYLQSIRAGRSSNELFPTELWLRDDQEQVEVPCGEPGCVRSSRMLRVWHEEQLARGDRFRCSICTEVIRLRGQTREQRARLRQVDATCGHCNRAGRVDPERLQGLLAEGKSFIHSECLDAFLSSRNAHRRPAASRPAPGNSRAAPAHSRQPSAQRRTQSPRQSSGSSQPLPNFRPKRRPDLSVLVAIALLVLAVGVFVALIGK